MTRDEIQLKALDLFKSCPNLILEWATGVGKTKAACMIIDHLASLTPNPKVLLLVAETAHKDNWRLEFMKWRGSNMFSLKVDCYNSIYKHEGEFYDLIIADEIHHIQSDLRLTSFEFIRFSHFLGLTATINKSTLFDLRHKMPDLSIYTVDMKQAISWGIILEPSIYIYGMDLDNTTETETIILTKGNSNRKAKLECSYKDYKKIYFKHPDIELLVHCTQKQKCDYYDSTSEYWKDRYMRYKQEWAKTKWLHTGTERKRWLGNLKTLKVKSLIEELNFENKRYICFCTTIDQATLLGKENALHSKNDKEYNSNCIKSFNKKEINSLFTVGMLQEGMNLVDIDGAILVQLDGQSRGFIQKTGRACRGKEPKIYIFYYRNTRDEEYLNKALDLVNRNIVQFIE